MRHKGLRGISKAAAMRKTLRNKGSETCSGFGQSPFKATWIVSFELAYMTYIPIWTGSLYLLAVIDIFNRKVVN